ncbi:Tannase/feruloyl esterase [Microdochium bolleyi]|uniref:Carboxylic ester hydrolase n=1 Tax=Microdochium bolleyi TaxID=196109 RepID=A0A136IQ62_9PEZI|nr:Tannase/feruloyl esterase [Microdochium bolleyi]
MPSTFSGITLYGAEIQSVAAALADATSPPAVSNFWPVREDPPPTVQVCNVTVTYTHPGWADTIHTWVQLPVSEDWNGRLLGFGGGGWVTGHHGALALPAARGFAAVATDGGHSLDQSVDDWALLGGENVNWHLLHDFAAVALDDAATLGKEVVRKFYGESPRKSYFNGCSTGGRQGHMLAQRYPDQYDGILATAAAFNWDRLLPADYWGFITMKEIGYYPPPCELAAITAAAIKACDTPDGVEDNITIDDSACDFDPHSVVGTQITCPDLNNTTITVSAGAARIAAAVWDGPRDDKTGRSLWHGFSKVASLVRLYSTQCQGEDAGSCVPAGFPIPAEYLRVLVSADKRLDVTSLTWAEYTRLFRLSVNQYASVLGTSDPDLTSFKRRGGKMITWHGLADELIPPGGTREYYERVVALDPARSGGGEEGDGVDGYYRYFEAPGIEHCAMGEGWYPGDALDALIAWVEQGEAPETLYAENAWAVARKPGSRKVHLCKYPKQLKFLGGDADLAESWGCEERKGSEEVKEL